MLNKSRMFSDMIDMRNEYLDARNSSCMSQDKSSPAKLLLRDDTSGVDRSKDDNSVVKFRRYVVSSASAPNLRPKTVTGAREIGPMMVSADGVRHAAQTGVAEPPVKKMKKNEKKKLLTASSISIVPHIIGGNSNKEHVVERGSQNDELANVPELNADDRAASGAGARRSEGDDNASLAIVKSGERRHDDESSSGRNSYAQQTSLNKIAVTQLMEDFRATLPMSLSDLMKTESSLTEDNRVEGESLRWSDNKTGASYESVIDAETELEDTEFFEKSAKDMSAKLASLRNNTMTLTDIQAARKKGILGMADVDMRLAPIERREMREIIVQEKKMAIIMARQSRKAKREAIMALRRLQQSWSSNMVQARFALNLWERFRIVTKEEARRRLEFASAAKIQIAWERFYAPIRAAKKKRIQVTLMKFSFRLLATLSRIRVRLARRKVLAFYRDFSRQRFAFVMVKFRFNCVKLQRSIRSYAQCTKARLAALSLLWNKLEPGIKQEVEKKLDSDGGTVFSDKWKRHLTLIRFPELAQIINSATDDCVSLRKVIQKGIKTVNVTLPPLIRDEAKRQRMAAKKSGGDRRGSKTTTSTLAQAQLNRSSVVTESQKINALKAWLTERRAVHGEYAWKLTRTGNVEAKQLNTKNVAKLISGELDIREQVDYKVNKIAWPTFLMLTDEEGHADFINMMMETVLVAIKRKNDEVQKLVKIRLQEELEKQSIKLEDLPGGYRYLKTEDANASPKAETSAPSKQATAVVDKKKSQGKARARKSHPNDSDSVPAIKGKQAVLGGFELGGTQIGIQTSDKSISNKMGRLILNNGGARAGESSTSKAKTTRTKRAPPEKKQKVVTAESIRITHKLGKPTPVTIDL